MKQIAAFPVVIKPSRHLLIVQSVAHVAAAGAVLATALPSWLTALLLILIGASLARLRRNSPVTGLVLGGDGLLQIVGPDGAASDAAVHPHTLVLSFLVVLLYRQQGGLHALTLPADSLATEDFRQLRLWLRWRAVAANPV
ncbi:MAG: hypothetical protein D4R84_16400 [Rhodocyclaceae bacterium]|nr:MAG: hypothetical protein D4R84_16400 [Rhodocyclaceae bacterium]